MYRLHRLSWGDNPMRLNPLRWKREHLVALIGLAIIGALAGAVFGNYLFYEIITSHHLDSSDAAFGGIAARYMTIWAAIGAVGVALLTYFFQLLRA
jgi:hypothetical protein